LGRERGGGARPGRRRRRPRRAGPPVDRRRGRTVAPRGGGEQAVSASIRGRTHDPSAARVGDERGRMRIAVVNWAGRKAGGIEAYLAGVIPALAGQGHRVAYWH